MMRSSLWFALALLALPSLASGSGTAPAGKAEPQIVPYLCSDGQTAGVIYRGGSDFRQARALVTHDGRTLAMQAAPTLYGVRYRSEAPAEPALAWSLRGEQAVLSEAPEVDSYTRPERELLRCVRVRGALAAQTHGPDTHH
jgi:hypothetical protein